MGGGWFRGGEGRDAVAAAEEEGGGRIGAMYSCCWRVVSAEKLVPLSNSGLIVECLRLRVEGEEAPGAGDADLDMKDACLRKRSRGR